MIEKLKISFLFYHSKENNKGETPIYCRIVLKTQKKQFATGLYITTDQWDKRRQMAKGKTVSATTINTHLEQIRSKLLFSETRLMIEQPENYTLNDIYDHYRGNFEDKYSLLKLFEERLDRMEKLIGSEYTIRTYRKFREVYTHLGDYIREVYHTKDISFKKLDYRFIQNLQEYLLIQKKHKPITANKIIQRVNQIVGLAVNYKYIPEHPFRNYKPLRESKQIVFLTEDELNILENYSFSQERLERIKDYFIFSVYTGLAYNEAFLLKKEHIIKGFDGNEWIVMTRQKTQGELQIPLLPKAKEIIRKYASDDREYILPQISNQRINSYLKEIGEIIGIKKKLTHHVARKTFASTILLYNDVPIEIVSKLMGHSHIGITQKSYAQVVRKGVSNHMNKLSKQFSQ